MDVRRAALFVAAATVLAGCDPMADCSPGLLEHFGDPRPGFMVFFDAGSSTLSETAHETIRSALKYATRPDATTIALEGHTDSTGGGNVNADLSRRRAEAVRKALVAAGISETRISIVAHGASRLLIPGNPHAPDNRRVEITVWIPTEESIVGYRDCPEGFRRAPSTTDRR
ncbi:MAG: OmpA family protein [Alphaproteobacteria bacterium]|nr:OmpA family protein [Alphaproteobacteria bacterium]